MTMFSPVEYVCDNILVGHVHSCNRCANDAGTPDTLLMEKFSLDVIAREHAGNSYRRVIASRGEH
jgi:hypothetical protein